MRLLYGFDQSDNVAENGELRPSVKLGPQLAFLGWGRIVMPLVQIKVIEGVIPDEKKREMIQKVTEAMVSVEGENLRPYTLVTLEEVKSGDWAVGGKPFETAEVRELAGRKSKAA
jgi:4-oxalocrotonate tautomerase